MSFPVAAQNGTIPAEDAAGETVAAIAGADTISAGRVSTADTDRMSSASRRGD